MLRISARTRTSMTIYLKIICSLKTTKVTFSQILNHRHLVSAPWTSNQNLLRALDRAPFSARKAWISLLLRPITCSLWIILFFNFMMKAKTQGKEQVRIIHHRGPSFLLKESMAFHHDSHHLSIHQISKLTNQWFIIGKNPSIQLAPLMKHLKGIRARISLKTISSQPPTPTRCLNST